VAREDQDTSGHNLGASVHAGKLSDFITVMHSVSENGEGAGWNYGLAETVKP